MKSIAHSRGHWQPLERKPIQLFDHGISVPRVGSVFVPDALSQGHRKERGQIVGFSFEARKRLRLALLTKFVPDAHRLGLTLTVPWKGSNFEPLLDEFRDCWHRFTVQFRRRFPRSGAIYRVELQQRGAPHIHAIIYLAHQDADAARMCTRSGRVLATDSVLRAVGVVIGDLWCKSVPDLHHGSYSAFLKRGALVEPILSDGAMMRYICDHASKCKQAQLGYKGKQWGLVAASNFKTAAAVPVPEFESPGHEVEFFRALRKVMRYRVTQRRCGKTWKRPPPFGSFLRGSRRSCGEFYLAADVVRQIWSYSLTLAQFKASWKESQE